jgi:hypothetical protein
VISAGGCIATGRARERPSEVAGTFGSGPKDFFFFLGQVLDVVGWEQKALNAECHQIFKTLQGNM